MDAIVFVSNNEEVVVEVKVNKAGEVRLLPYDPFVNVKVDNETNNNLAEAIKRDIPMGNTNGVLISELEAIASNRGVDLYVKDGETLTKNEDN